MIVEFIGSTGAGKTTLLLKVQRQLTKTVEVMTPYDLVAAPWGLQGVTHPTVRNLAQELLGLPFFMRSLPRNKALVIFTLRMLARHGKCTLSTISNLRSLERKLGMYEATRRRKRERIILVDEGPILLAHNIFVFTSALYAEEEIDEFASLVPVPDVVIYVRATRENLIRRSLQRTDHRREIESVSQAELERYLERATAVFDQLVTAENIRSRVLIVENPDFAEKDHKTEVERIANLLLRRDSSTQAGDYEPLFTPARDLLEGTRDVS